MRIGKIIFVINFVLNCAKTRISNKIDASESAAGSHIGQSMAKRSRGITTSEQVKKRQAAVNKRVFFKVAWFFISFLAMKIILSYMKIILS